MGCHKYNTESVYPELQQKYCADPASGPCPMYNVGDEFIFERYADKDDFWRMGCGRQCSEAWDAISRYIYTGLQGGSIMRGWMRDERQMIACCSDGTRPVIFKIERMDYKVLRIEGIKCDGCREEILSRVKALDGVSDAQFRPEWLEVFMDGDVSDSLLKEAVEKGGRFKVTSIE